MPKTALRKTATGRAVGEITKSETVVGILGGTGLYDLPGLTSKEELRISTPFGLPSTRVTRAKLGDVTLLFIARHGIGHTLLPFEINYRANIYAFKLLGAQWCISVSAVGSLKEEIAPGDIIFPDQTIDRTRRGEGTFFGRGIVAHVPFGTPYCPTLRNELFRVASAEAAKCGPRLHNGGTYVCIEGPAFSSRAESNFYRLMGGSVIGMTNLPEAKLAREAQISYATLAMVTDYDCWKTEESDVSVDEIMKSLETNTKFAKQVLHSVCTKLPQMERPSLVRDALKGAIITEWDRIPVFVKHDLELIIGTDEE